MKIAVVGAGVLGRLIALMAVREGCQVHLYDKNPLTETTGTSWVAGGMLAPLSESLEGDRQIMQLSKDAIGLWGQILGSLDSSLSVNMSGSLIVSHSRDESLFEDYRSRIEGFFGDGYLESVSYSVLSQRDLCAKEPDLRGIFSKALFFPNEAYINPSEVLNALETSLRTFDVSFWVSPNGYVPRANEVLEAAEGTCHSFDRVIDCRGYGAASSLSELRGVRGEALLIRCNRISLSRPIRLLHPRYSLYLVPRPENCYYLGATSIESDSDDDISVRSVLELLSACYSVHPEFSEAEVLKSMTGIRPAFPEHFPRIQEIDGVISVNGLYRHGYLLAPSLAQKCIDQIVRN